MLAEQLAPPTALHCNSVAGNFKTKDENCYISYTDCDSIRSVQQQQQQQQQQQLQDINISMTRHSSTTPVATATVDTSNTTTEANILTNTTTITTIEPSTKAAKTTLNTTNTNTTTTTISKTTGSLRKSGITSAATRHKPPTNDASGRSAALERAYVHDVYENCEEPSGPIRPRVAQFLGNLDPGAVVCDVGCGSGRYLTQCNPLICTVGVDRCYRLSKVAHEKGGEVAICDNLELPFRDESFDAVLSLAVVHHFATTERRVVALRELARILRIGGRVIITVWALEQRHRRFESQDVLIPWQPPKNRNFNYSDEEDDDDFLPPYHAYTEDSTNSSRSAGDGDSSSLSSSSPGESCYSFVRRAIQKLAGGRKHPWFLDSWTSKDTKNDSSLDYEDARDLPIELRRLEDFEDFPDPPLSAGLKSRSLGSILNPPPRQIVRSRSSVPSLGGPLIQAEATIHKQQAQAQFLSLNDSSTIAQSSHSPTNNTSCLGGPNTSASSLNRRPKLIKQKQSLCDEDYQLPENPFHMISSYNSSNNSVNNSLYMKSGCYVSNSSSGSGTQHHHPPPTSTLTARQMAQASMFLRKQSSLNEELMAGNRIREKERVRKRIQKQMSLNEAFLCRSALFSKRLQVIREGFTTKIKTSTGSLERVTKNGLTKIIQNFKTGQNQSTTTATETTSGTGQSYTQASMAQTHCQHHQQQQQQQHHHHHHSHHHHAQNHLPQILHKPISLGGIIASKFNGPVTYCSGTDCASAACYCSTYQTNCPNNPTTNSTCCTICSNEDQQNKPRRHSRESGSDSSKDSSLQSDTSIESEDSFASVIFIPKPEQHQQQLNYQQQHQNSNSSSSNSSSSNGGQCSQLKGGGSCGNNNQTHQCKASSCNHFSGQQQQYRVPSVPTSPLIMPCPPTPAHSPAAAQASVTSPPQTMAAVTAAMAILTPPTPAAVACNNEKNVEAKNPTAENWNSKNRFNFDEAHIKQQKQQEKDKVVEKPAVSSSKQFAPKITRQTIKDLPPIPKFRKQQSLQFQRQSFPIVRRSSATAGAVPSIPKLLSLELFNPATDDLDSDSSEPSSPDSIDSVISAPKSASLQFATEETKSEIINNNQDLQESIKVKQQQYHNGELKINSATPNDIILNDDSANILPTHSQGGQAAANGHPKQPDCAAFAEQLSAQLQRELDDKNNRAECRSLDGIGDITDFLDDTLACHKKRNGEVRDLTAFREELRERRLMLANLSTQPSLQQSPTSSSTSSLSSQTRSFTIHEEDEEEDAEEENERSYTLQLYENCKISKFNYKRNRHYNLNPETAYLLQDDGDSSIRDDDDIDDIEHDVILEEDEEAAAAEDLEADGGDELGETIHEYGRKNSRNTIKCDSIDDNSPAGSSSNQTVQKVKATSVPTEGGGNKPLQPPQQQQQQQQQQQFQNRQSTESWENSNSSTTSLDSPSQGGATTHHRYYHVFREGELDALINHHVASLHIVSSYYERASWCVIAEKVQMWTI